MKHMTIMGTFWDFWVIPKIYEKLFESKYISIYEPWLKGDIDKDKIILLNEKNQSGLLWPLKIILRTFKFIKHINNFKPDIIVTHHDDANISILLTMFIYKFLLKKKTKFIAYIHNGNYEHHDILHKIIKFCIKNFYKYFDKIITVSYENEIMLKSKFNLKNLQVIYNPIDIETGLNMANQESGELNNLKEIYKNNLVFLNIGRLTYQKGQGELIKAFKKINNFNKNTKLIIIGKGELESDLKKLVEELELENEVLFLGRQNNVFKYIKYCNFFILSSIWESFGQVLVEALSLNKIVISTDCKSGPREILSPELKLNEEISYPYLGRYGVLSDKNISSKTLFETMDFVIKNEEKLKDKYSNGIEGAKNFDILNITKIYKDLYKL